MSDIFSDISPFNDDPPTCDIPSASPNIIDLTYGIDCPPSGCPTNLDQDLTNIPYVFLNCYIENVSAKLGVGGSESTVTVDLIDPVYKDCDTHPSICPTPDAVTGYNGTIGSVYSLQIGGFNFRGILTNHEYQEGPSGFKYRLTLTDGRSLLGNTSVIVGGYYSSQPNLGPNLINALAIKNESVATELLCNTESGNLCKDFGKSGATHSGMYVYRAIQAIHNQYVKIPVSGLCLNIDVSLILYLINADLFNKSARCGSEIMTAIDLIEYGCNQSGYLFYTTIIDDSIIVVPIKQSAIGANNNSLFTFMNEIATTNIVIDRDYGQEMTYNKSQTLVIGQPVHYMISVDNMAIFSGAAISYNDEPQPSSVCQDGQYADGAFAYQRMEYDYFSGGDSTIIDGADCSP